MAKNLRIEHKSSDLESDILPLNYFLIKWCRESVTIGHLEIFSLPHRPSLLSGKYLDGSPGLEPGFLRPKHKVLPLDEDPKW